jgi:hypothetical protein
MVVDGDGDGDEIGFKEAKAATSSRRRSIYPTNGIVALKDQAGVDYRWGSLSHRR